MQGIPNNKLQFKPDQRLEDEELARQLFQNEPLEVNPGYWGSLIKLNSTYLETPDVIYGQQGWLTLWSGISSIAFAAFPLLIVFDIFKKIKYGIQFTSSDLVYIIGSLLISILASYFFGWLAKSEFFKYTHMPVRLNRKTRMVHVFRFDGSALSVPWDEVFFNVGLGRYKGPFQPTFIAGHVMEGSKRYPKETFILGGHASGLAATLSLWEFFRRYMEEGPESALEDTPQLVCLPLDRGKEPFSAGMTVVHREMGSPNWFLGTILFPIRVLQSCARWLAFRTCKVPAWPKEIEATCTIEPDDPHVHDVTTNPPGYRFGY